MASKQPLCTFCGATMRPDDGRLVCVKAGREHPTLRLARNTSLRGGWSWALGLGAGTMLTLSLVLWLLMPLLQYEPLLMALALAGAGVLLGAAPMFGFRMFRTSPHEWNRPSSFLLVAAGSWVSAGSFGLVMQGSQGNLPAAFSLAIGWLTGLLGLYLPYSAIPSHPGERLVRSLQRHVARPSHLGCDVTECPHVGIPCQGKSNRCRRTLCGTHWIQSDGRCTSCGASHVPPTARKTRPVMPVGVAIALCLVMASGLLIRGLHG